MVPQLKVHKVLARLHNLASAPYHARFRLREQKEDEWQRSESALSAREM